MRAQQASTELSSPLEAIIEPLKARLQHTRVPADSRLDARHITTAVALSTTRRGGEPKHNPIQYIAGLTNHCSFKYTLQWVNPMRDSIDHSLTIAYVLEEYVLMARDT